MQVTLVNRSDKDISLTPVAAIPVFARGADHIRDHRHVTSLLNVIKVEDDGVTVKPTMALMNVDIIATAIPTVFTE